MRPRALKFFLAIAIVLVAHTGLRAWYDAAAPSRSIAYATAEQLVAARDNVEILFLGDSHVKCGIDARAIPGAFNLATLGAQYHHIYHDLRWAIEDLGVAPTTVVLPLDTHSFAWQPARMEEAPYWSQRFSYPTLAREFDYPNYWRRWFDGAWFPYWGEGEFMLRWSLGRSIEGLSYEVHAGFVGLDARWSDTPPEERSAAAEQRIAFLHGDYKMFHEVEMKYFRRAIALCREHDIEVVLVRTPMSATAITITNEHDAAPSMETMIKRSGVDAEGIALLDFGNVLKDKPHLFADADHLNKEGAEEFTKRLVDAL